MNAQTLDYRRALILAIIAKSDSDLYWRVARVSDLRTISEEDLRAVLCELARFDAEFGYFEAEKPTTVADCVENAIGFLNKLID